MNKKFIVLASASRRRSQILKSCGIDHLVLPSRIEEIHPKKKNVIPSVMKNAEVKTRTVLKETRDLSKKSIIIGADTLVTFKNEVIGKPLDGKEAKNILRKFSGSEINVHTGLFVLDAHTNKHSTGYEKSVIFVDKINENDIHRYFRKLGSFDKAGGFSIEGVGSLIFDNIKGSYFNILGLPMGRLSILFSKIGLNLLDFCKK